MPVPVSYTHLDVYKRQVLTTVTMFVLFFKKLLRNMDEEHVEEAKQQTQLEEKEA